MARGNFKVKPASGSLRGLERLRASLGDLRPALTNASRELTRRIYYRFSFKRDPDGRPWSPWASSTREKYKNQPNRKLMLNTRELRASAAFVPGRTALRALVGQVYGVYHEQPQRDGAIVPRRAFLFSRRNGRRALAVNDEKYLLNAVNYQIRKAAGARK